MRKLLSLLLLFVSLVFAQAQPGKSLDLNVFKDRNQTVKNAVAPGLYIIQQQYIALDSAGKEYGFNNQDNFGAVYSVGIRIKEGIILPSSFKYPGNFDPNFEPYKTTHTTRTSGIKARNVDSVKYDALKVADLQADIPRINLAAANDYFPIKHYKDVKEAKLALIYTDDITKLEQEPAKINILQVDDLNWDDKGIAQPKNLVIGNKTALGGVLFHEEVSFGKVVYQPVAFYENVNGSWVFTAIDIKQSPAGGLNPIDKKKK